jgi:uncharacterized cupredoxin-like copper-binding protein
MLVTIRMLAIFVFTLLILAGCGGEKTPVVQVRMEDFKFSPSHWKAEAGSQVTVRVANHGAVEHEWMILRRNYKAVAPFDENDRQQAYWQIRLERSQHGDFTFTAPDEPGEYQVICSIPGHLELGMTGTLIVTPATGEAVVAR